MTPELRMHLGLLRWWNLAASGFKLDPRVLIHIPNGGKRGRVEAAIFKGMGTRAGTPDLLLIAPRGGYAGMALELKAPSGRLSVDQAQMLDLFEKHGWRKMIVWSFDEAVAAITNYLLRGDPTLQKHDL